MVLPCSLSHCMRTLLLLSVSVWLLVGCAGTRSIQEKVYSLSRSGKTASAVEYLDASNLAESRTDRLLYLMERGTLLQRQGEYRESNATFEEADRLSEELYTKSISAGALSFLVNEGVVAYTGADYESVYLNYYKLLNYLALGNLEAAGVEARRVDEKLRYFSDRYEEKTVFREDPFLRMLTGLIYHAQRDFNNAFIAYRLAWNGFLLNRDIYRVPPPQILWSLLVTTAESASLLREADEFRAMAAARGIALQRLDTFAVVLVNNGRIPVKQERMALFPSGHGFPVKIALPAFVSRDGGATTVTAIVDGQRYQAELVENLEAIASKSLDDEIGRVLVKAIARAVAKEATARQLDNKANGSAGLLLRVVNLMTEHADLRSWVGLPREIKMLVAPVATGTAQIDLEQDGRPLNLKLVLPATPVGFGFVQFF
ncbi:MAG: hypothetical protein IBX47_00075 [Desulfuromonadales bacterium]|nr:hypothetical protein [Desulfuromonadales bacterium]